MKRSTQPRVLIFTHDGRGLGHLRRLSRIARVLQGKCAVLFITGHRDAEWLVPSTCEYIHVPSLDSLDQYQSRQWGRRPFWESAKEEGIALRQALLNATVRSFNPDAIIVDFLPIGKNEELFHLLDTSNAAKYFIIRGVLDTLEQVRSIVLTNKGEYLLEQRYDRIFVTADPAVIDVREEYQLSDVIASKLVYTGYVVDRVDPEERQRVRLQRELPAGVKWVVCSAGGGKDGEHLIERCYDLTHIYPEVYFDIVIGPRSRLRMEESCRRTDGRVRIIRQDSQLPLLHASADVAICRGGYNSLLECVSGSARVITVPIPGDNEQLMHASRLARVTSLSILQDLDLLEWQVEQELAVTEPQPPFALNCDGAERVAQIIFGDMRDRRASKKQAEIMPVDDLEFASAHSSEKYL